MTGRQPADRAERYAWLDALKDSDLPPMTVLAAECYARYLGAKSVWGQLPDNEVMLVIDELCRRTHMSRNTAGRVTHKLRDLGWLVVVQAADRGRGRVPVRYRIAIPNSPMVGRFNSPMVGRLAQVNSPMVDTNSPMVGIQQPHGGAQVVKYLEREPRGGTAGPRPRASCQRHPNGAAGPCQPCGDARQHAEAWDAAERQQNQQWLTWNGHQPDCEHGNAGGENIRPWTGTAACSTCRHQQQQQQQLTEAQ